jgi:molybdate transport system ATP-binding protein
MLDVRIQHQFGDFTLDVAFTAPPGLTAITGPSGAGKTSIINAVAGLFRPDAGEVRFQGELLFGPGVFVPPHKRRFGYVFQDARLFPHLTVRQNLAFGAWFAGGAAEMGRVVDLLGIGGLLARRPAALSGGEKQRVALGRALLAQPRMLLMDEPLASLDTARKDEILPYLERLRDAGTPVLYVSHAPDEVARLATTVIHIRDGHLAPADNEQRAPHDPAMSQKS